MQMYSHLKSGFTIDKTDSSIFNAALKQGTHSSRLSDAYPEAML